MFRHCVFLFATARSKARFDVSWGKETKLLSQVRYEYHFARVCNNSARFEWKLRDRCEGRMQFITSLALVSWVSKVLTQNPSTWEDYSQGSAFRSGLPSVVQTDETKLSINSSDPGLLTCSFAVESLFGQNMCRRSLPWSVDINCYPHSDYEESSKHCQ